jgi:hypothetical protein
VTVHVIRDDADAHRTFGRLSINGQFQAFTLEDPVREGPKIAHETAIPEGRYPIAITRSQRFGCLLPLVMNVPDFEGIRIHAGNTTADTSGCILVGMRRSADMLLDSRLALGIVQQRIAQALARGEPVWLEIEHAREPVVSI